MASCILVLLNTQSGLSNIENDLIRQSYWNFLWRGRERNNYLKGKEEEGERYMAGGFGSCGAFKKGEKGKRKWK